MENFVNYKCTEENWEQHIFTVPYQGGAEVPVLKQRCQANARERDRTQKLVLLQKRMLKYYLGPR